MSIAKKLIKLLVLCSILLSVKESYTQVKSKNGAIPSFKKCWEYDTSITSLTNFASDNVSKLYLLGDGNLEAIDLGNGTKLWNTEISSNSNSAIWVKNSSIYILTEVKDKISNKLFLTTVSTETGVVNSKEQVNNNRNLDLRNVSSSANQDFVKNNSNALMVVQIQRLLNLDKMSLKSFATVSEIVDDQKIVVGDNDGLVQLIGLQSEQPDWSFKVGGKVSSLTALEKKIIVTSFDNFVYVISASNGDKIWKKRLLGRIEHKPIVDENFLIFTVVGEESAFVLDIETGKQIGTIETEGLDNLVKPLGKVLQNYIFHNNKGLISFSLSNCVNK